MSASVAGLPYAMQSTPVGGSGDTRDLPLMDNVDQQLEVFKGRRRHHAMPEVEDVPRATTRAPEYVAGPLADQLWRSQQHGRVQVSLDASIRADPIPAAVQWNAPVEGDDVWTRRS